MTDDTSLTGTLHLIEPCAPLIVRDGKPFNNDPGARATTLAFPFPSTATGGLRTRAGHDENGRFDPDPANLKRVKGITVRGPLLVELSSAQVNGGTLDAPDDEGDIALDEEGKPRFLVPAPRDCVWLEPRGEGLDKTKVGFVKQLVPAKVPGELQTDGFASDHAGSCDEAPTAEVVSAFSHREDDETKALTGPHFWHWARFAAWLREADAAFAEGNVTWSELGMGALERDERTHVRMDDELLSHDGLFSTQGLVFKRWLTGERAPRRFALALQSESPDGAVAVAEGAGHLGGERRMVSWKTSTRSLPECDWIKAIARAKACRAVLLTPALFRKGWKPGFLLEAREGVKPELIAACVGRAEVVSGWDFEFGRAKPTRRLVPSGSTFFLRLRDASNPEFDATDDAITRWVKALWLHPISDEDIDRRDGFGVVAIGVADKTPREDLL